MTTDVGHRRAVGSAGAAAAAPPNLRVLKRSNRLPSPGDVFRLSPADGVFLFGRVVQSDLPRERAPMPGAYLVYLYRHRWCEGDPPRPDDLRPGALLLPPLFINRMPWTKGYFETVATWPLTASDVLERHCFWSVARQRYVDEHSRELPGPLELCGEWALQSYRTLDDAVSEAIGIPLASR